MNAPDPLGVLLAAATEQFDEYAERILIAARKQVAEYGLKRTSLDDIARAAEVSRATLFRRFPNREALTFALAAREARAGIAAIDQKVARIEDAEEFLVAGGLEVIHQLARNDLLSRLLVSDTDQILRTLTIDGGVVLAIGRDFMAGHLRRLRASGATIIGDLDLLAELLARLVLSLAINPNGLMPLHDDEQLEQVLRSTLVPMVLRPAGAPQ